jgi:hypothetical protein
MSPPKRRTVSDMHGIKTKKTLLFIVTAVGFLLVLLFDPEDGSYMFFRNIN